MYGLQICQLVVVGIYADAEEKAGISPIHKLVVAELRNHMLRPVVML